jgi:L-lactate dehydrogenase complex protein LldG
MTQDARGTILARIGAAIDDAPEPVPVIRDYRQRDEREHQAIIEDLIDRLLDYKAIVTRTNEAELPQAIADACRQHRITRLVAPADIPGDWIPGEVTALRDEPPLAVTDLDTSDGVLTGCALAIAQTGTIILDGGSRQGRRALSLVPDRHLCVVRSEQVVGLVPEAIAALTDHATRPITLISGPSATSDIELSRVEGVHGPRTLHVFVIW